MDKMPVYVRIDEYQDVLRAVDDVKKKLDTANKLLDEITQLKNEEDAEVESWKIGLEDIHQKLTYFDKVFFKPEDYK